MLDAGAWLPDIRRFVFSKFSGSIRRVGLDPEDVISEVALGLVIRNRGTCSWSPEGGLSQSSYVYMVTRSVVLNMLRSRKLRKRHEIHTLMSRWGETNDEEALRSVSDTHKYLIENWLRAPAEMGPLLTDLQRHFANDPEPLVYLSAAAHGMGRSEMIKQGLFPSLSHVSAVRRRLWAFLWSPDHTMIVANTLPAVEKLDGPSAFKHYVAGCRAREIQPVTRATFKAYLAEGEIKRTTRSIDRFLKTHTGRLPVR